MATQTAGIRRESGGMDIQESPTVLEEERLITKRIESSEKKYIHIPLYTILI